MKRMLLTMKNLKLITILLLSTTQMYASNIDNELITRMYAYSYGYAFLILILFIIIYILYIISQNKLIDTLKTDDDKFKTHTFWTWTQLIPLWSFVAQVVALVQMTDQYEVFIKENNIKPSEISEYKPIWGWFSIGASVLSSLLPSLFIIAIGLWIVYWVNISSTTKSIQHYLDTSSIENENKNFKREEK